MIIVESAQPLSHRGKKPRAGKRGRLQSPASPPPGRPDPDVLHVADADEILHHDAMQERLQEVRTLLDRQKRVESLVHRQEMPRHELVETLVAKQHHNELTK